MRSNCMSESVGVVHGRFQPFHNGHMEYVLAALEQCSFLLVGITQFDRSGIDPGSPEHRLNSEQNPFLYWERTLMISEALRTAGVPQDRYAFVPFPISEPSRIRQIVPANAVMYTTVYDDWNREKISRLRDVGFDVRILWERSMKTVEGMEVRKALASGGLSKISGMVPDGVVDALRRIEGMKSQ